MGANLAVPERCIPVGILEPKADNAGRTGDYISLKNANMAWIVAYIDQGNAATIALTPKQASLVDGTGVKVISATQIWSNEDLAATSVLTRQTDAANLTTSAAVKLKMVIFQINPDALDVANGFDCITLVTGSSNAANITSAFLLVEPRYDSNTNMIID